MGNKAIRIIAAIVIGLVLLAGAGYFWFTQNYEVTQIFFNTKQCPLSMTQVSLYKFAAYQNFDIQCNTKDLQQATATLEDGTSYSFFLEYDGDFVSWSAPDGFECKQASWTDLGPIASEGVTQISGQPKNVMMTCNDQEGHALFMQGSIYVPTY